MALSDKFELPSDPELKGVWLIGVGAVVVLVLIGRAFRDVNPG